MLNTKFHYLNESDIEKAYLLMKEHGPTVIPVVDKNFILKDVVTSIDIMEHLALVKKNNITP